MVTFRLMGLAVAEFAWSADDDDDSGGGGEFELYEDLEVWGTIDDVEEFYEMDSEEARFDVPGGFRWSCCQRVGEVKCCRKGQHVAVLEHGPLTLGSFGEGDNAVGIPVKQSHGKRKAEEDIAGIAQRTRTGSRRI
ncbi:hypothetical protein BDP81DRAFT_400833 [Colletotrichum phormii]|uniref:Uncharacterized protein n=1 Tax=Colletotrichum phormii TaxID=359342 RepID=A0AAJ0E8L6_9PEZI|nr:uncharacterized protein BDP81DRAFT_400833 [Colletotrichum phormii]KAK1621810.1 hypothetical protein BDP81DRAFT_400833 [Colletotrichum phormii]